METTVPMPITSNKLCPKPTAPAAAIGPGVGGMKTWEAYKPPLSATAVPTGLAAIFLRNASLIGFNTTKPLSQNTGIPTTQPIISIANSGRF